MSADVLVVAVERELRRAILDAFDIDGGPDVLSARDISHAAILLAKRPRVQLIIALLSGDAPHAVSQCRRLAQLTGPGNTPLLAIVGGAASFDPSELPRGVTDWLFAAHIQTELVPRWRRALAARPLLPELPPAIAAALTGDGDGCDYRYAFDEGGTEWLIADQRTHRLIEVSPRVAACSGTAAAGWAGLALENSVRFDGISVEQIIDDADPGWHRCQRRSAYGNDPGQASIRRVRHAGRDALALMFRSDRADQRAHAALSLLARIFAPVAVNEVISQAAAARALFDALGLDYLTVWSGQPDDADGPRQVLQLCRGDGIEWPPAALQDLLQQVLRGLLFLGRTDAIDRARAGPLLPLPELASCVGVPLYDERHTVIGALLAGTHREAAEPAVVELVLRCAAARFAQAIELGRARAQGRAEGLLDPLTGLPNRLLFNDRLDTIIRQATRNGECFAVLFVDLDNFKAVNDTHGHAAGDHVLRVVAQRLVASVRASDTVARYAGDEFVVVLRHVVRKDDVLRVAEKLVQAVSRSLPLENGSELDVTVSMGLSLFPEDASDTQTLLKHADEAMYAAKHRGRNTFRIYEMSPQYAQQQSTVLRSRLRLAQGNGELRMAYQPQVNAFSEDIVGMEALIRWEHPELGPISPSIFIPLAEETGLIVAIGEWVLRTACRQAQAWENRYGLRLRLGVNLSAVQLIEPGLVATVTSVLQETGLDPTLLELEITESISLKTAPNLIENLNALRRLGCHLAIDDFGTGAASLDYLRRLPANRIKIDQSFVRNIGVDPDDEAIVRATIDMAHRLKRAVIAEGVETEQHAEFLRAQNCDELQGYLFCRPLQPLSFGNLLAERQRRLELRGVKAA